MNKQFATSLAALTLVVSTGGCSGMRHFLFGRGAACSSCAAAPTYGIAAPLEPSCGYEPTCGYERPLAGLHRGQATCNAAPDCACHSGSQSYMPSEVGSYSSQVHDPYAYGGEVVGSEVMGDSYNGYTPQGYPIYSNQGTVLNEGMVPGATYYNGTTGDDFNARGQGIIQGTPMPSGSVRQP